MTRNDIIRMAIDAGLVQAFDREDSYIRDGRYDRQLENFADLVAAAEREECASIVENADTPDCGGWTAHGIADAIRSRQGKKREGPAQGRATP